MVQPKQYSYATTKFCDFSGALNIVSQTRRGVYNLIANELTST
jgi:hypothetical protein